MNVWAAFFAGISTGILALLLFGAGDPATVSLSGYWPSVDIVTLVLSLYIIVGIMTAVFMRYV